jgi:hypothetical protein
MAFSPALLEKKLVISSKRCLRLGKCNMFSDKSTRLSRPPVPEKT